MVFAVCRRVAQNFGLGGMSWRLKPHQQLQSPPSRTNPPSRRRSASHGLRRFQSQPMMAARGSYLSQACGTRFWIGWNNSGDLRSDTGAGQKPCVCSSTCRAYVSLGGCERYLAHSNLNIIDLRNSIFYEI